MTRAQAVSAGLGGDIAAPTMQQDMAWAPQLRNTSCLSPQPEHAQIALKTHGVPELLYQIPRSISPPPSLPCSTVAPAPHPPAPFCLLSPVKATAFAKAFTAVLKQLPSSHVLLSIHILSCPLPSALSPSGEEQSPRLETYPADMLLSPRCCPLVPHCHNS